LWIPPPAILHRYCNIKDQQRKLPDAAVKTTVYFRVTLRACKLVQANLDFWTNFGQNLVSAFGVDVYGNRNAFKSASLLAFESVWTQIAHLGGPLVQGPEKMKTRYTMMLRSATGGGLMYSA
jgi:hypothetical protein